MKRNFILINWCVLCKTDAETIDHLFIHCPFAIGVWNYIMSSFGVSWVMPRSILDVICCWKGVMGKQGHGKVWDGFIHHFLWSIWTERNDRVFNDLEHSSGVGQRQLFRVVFDWSRLFVRDVPSSLSDFLVFLSQ